MGGSAQRGIIGEWAGAICITVSSSQLGPSERRTANLPVMSVDDWHGLVYGYLCRRCIMQLFIQGC